MKPNKSVFEQFNVGIWWGAFRNLLQQANFYLLLITCISSVTTLFVTVVSPWLAGNFGVRIPFYVVLLITIGVLLGILLFEHKFTMPSFMSYWNAQWWKHDNPSKKELEELGQKIDKIMKALKIEKED